MAWEIKISKKAENSLASMDATAARRIKQYLEEKVATDLNPRRLGKSLQGNLAGYWRYMVGDYRIICEIHDEEVVVLVIEVGHRSKIYGGH